jgi:hypothetical protein
MIRKPFVVAALAAALLAAPALAQEKLKYPNLHAALYELREASKELSGIKGDAGGHKKKSLAAAANAIRSVKLILVVDDEKTAPLKRGKDFYKKWKDYPRARAALEDLRAAQGELQEAKSDFQGNQKQAQKDIEAAIREIRALLDTLH